MGDGEEPEFRLCKALVNSCISSEPARQPKRLHYCLDEAEQLRTGDRPC